MKGVVKFLIRTSSLVLNSSLILSEINKVRVSLFHLTSSKEPFVLPSGEGAVVTLSEKVFVPVKDHPDVSIKFQCIVIKTCHESYKLEKSLLDSDNLTSYQYYLLAPKNRDLQF